MRSLSDMSGITVVIPTLERSECLRVCIEDLLAQNYAPIEILIVDQSAEPDEYMRGLARRSEAVSYHHVAFQSLPKARNYGWRHARYDAILYLDDDIRCQPGLIAGHARSLQGAGVGVVGGGVDELSGSYQSNPEHGGTGIFNRTTAFPQRSWTARGEFEVDHAAGGNFSVWRRVLEACGGIDESLGVGAALYEETDFCLRAKRLGYRVLYNGGARITHLAIPRGGCRVLSRATYVRGLAHNRAVLIGRHVERGRQFPALARLMMTGISFAVRDRDPFLVGACLRGVKQGLHDSRILPPAANAACLNAIEVRDR